MDIGRNTVVVAAALFMAATAFAADEREWGDVGKADAAGWLSPVELPSGEDRVLAECAGIPKERVKGVTGRIWAEFFFDPASMAKKPGGYVELFVDGVRGMANGAYNRDCPADGHVVTKKILVMEDGSEASFGVLKPDSAAEREIPAKCRLVSTELTAVLRFPSDGAVLADSTPDFAWYTEDPLGVVVEVSRDPSFPDGKTMRRERRDQLPFVVWDEPLEPGVWHWRVRTRSGFTTAARSFRQTADAAADCNPPDLFCVPRFMASRDAIYAFTVGEDTVSVSAVLCGEKGNVRLDARSSGSIAGVKPPPEGWPVGVSKMILSAADEKGNVARASAWVSFAEGIPQVVWGGAGEKITVDGEPFDLVGMYTVDIIDDLDRVRSLGVNCVQSYYRDQHMMDARSAEFLEAIEIRGMKTFVSVCRDDVRRGCFSRIAEKVGAYLPRKCLLAWYLSDEPEIQDFCPVTPRAIRRFSDFVKALDPSRPKIVTHYFIPYGAQRYVGAGDVHFSQLYRATLGEVRDKFDEHRKWFGEYRPDLKYTLIVNPRASESAETLASQVSYARTNGCGVVFYAWHEALKNELTMQKLERAARLAGLAAKPAERTTSK